MTTCPGMSEGARELAAANVRLAWKLAGRAARFRPGHADEIESEALLALCDAARDFDPSLGYAFSTFAHACIRYRLRGLFKGRRRVRTILFGDLAAMGDEDPAAGVVDHREEDPGRGIDLGSASASLREALEALPRRWRFVVRARHFEGLTLKEVAARLAEAEGREVPHTTERIRQIEAKALKHLDSILRLRGVTGAV